MATTTSPRIGRRTSGRRPRPRAASSLPQHQPLEVHHNALHAIRTFLKGRSSYDVFPVSFRLIVLDNKLEVKKALSALINNGVVSAPLWNADESCFAGMFTVADIIHLIQYYYDTSSYSDAAADVEHFQLESLREIERALDVPPPPMLSIHPLRPLYDACQFLMHSHARRLPLLDRDQQTGDEVVLSVLTQYRVLKFIAINCPQISHLHLGLRQLGIGTYVQPSSDHPDNPFHPLRTATMETTVFDVVHMFSKDGISAVPIVDSEGIVVNLYETVDIITLVRNGAYHSLDLTISAALSQRSPDFPGVITCTSHDSLASLMLLIKQRRVHRLVVIEGDEASKGRDRWPERERSRVRGESVERSPPGGDAPKKGRLVGIITLSDVMRYLVGHTERSFMSGGIGGEWDDSELEVTAAMSAGGSNEGHEYPPGLDYLGFRGESRRSGENADLSMPGGSGGLTPLTNTATPATSTPGDENGPS